MSAPRNRKSVKINAITLLWLAGATGAAMAQSVVVSSSPFMYRLASDPLAEQSLLSSRWTSPALSLRLETAAGLGGGHEIRLLSLSNLSDGLQLARTPSFGDSVASWSVDPVRATYRYTLLEQPQWTVKLGLSTNLRDSAWGSRLSLTNTDSLKFGALPLLHVAGEGQWSPRWRLAFAMDGLMTARGRTLDLGVQVNYLWSRSMSVYGGYQLTEAAGDAEGFYGNGLNNRANFGLRYRF